MASGIIEELLKRANSSSDGDTSVNDSKRFFGNEQESIAFFNETRSKMLRIAEWNKNSSASDYKVFDESGSVVTGKPISVGDFIRINLYGSGKFDWVRVTSITDEETEFVITVQPSYDPTSKPNDPSTVSHFFGPEARNNFCLKRHDKAVAFYVIGLDEKQNTKFTDGLIETARNVAVANIGYYSGLQKAVWKEFASNFLKQDGEKEI